MLGLDICKYVCLCKLTNKKLSNLKDAKKGVAWEKFLENKFIFYKDFGSFTCGGEYQEWHVQQLEDNQHKCAHLHYYLDFFEL